MLSISFAKEKVHSCAQVCLKVSVSLGSVSQALGLYCGAGDTDTQAQTEGGLEPHFVSAAEVTCHYAQQPRDWKARVEQMLSCWTVNGEHGAGKHVTRTSGVCPENHGQGFQSRQLRL